jgi:hypothetical protein
MQMDMAYYRFVRHTPLSYTIGFAVQLIKVKMLGTQLYLKRTCSYPLRVISISVYFNSIGIRIPKVKKLNDLPLLQNRVD